MSVWLTSGDSISEETPYQQGFLNGPCLSLLDSVLNFVFEHFLAFWYDEMFHALLVYFLLLPEDQPFLQGA